jgi:hypothetical protein
MSDQIAIGYFILTALLAIVRPLPASRRALTVAASAVMIAAIQAVTFSTGALRDLFPMITLLAAYYLSGMLCVRPSRSMEAWLTAWDRRLLGDPERAFTNWPPWLLNALDLLYLGTFLTVPAGLLALWLTGQMRLAGHYWTIVMTALLICYAGTALVHTRPPRTLERTRERAGRRLQHAALDAVDRLSIGANTIPSGHVAAPLAIALALMESLPIIAAAFLAFAIVVTAACLAGRYHFIFDCALGALVAVAAATWQL